MKDYDWAELRFRPFCFSKTMTDIVSFNNH